ncbi:MAG: EamA family transporter [Parvularculaceae bacterium]|jgi:multidrug transporter EmrE-like cation transporter|nr:EamA family transporter [Parvularculaceae bacterium]
MTATLAYAFALTAVIAIMAGQFLFKKVALAIAGQPLSQAVRNPEALLYFMLAAAIYGAATIFWVLALRQLPLSRAYMLMAIGFVLVPIVSHFSYGEPMSARFFVGAALIAVGVVVTNTS